MAAFKLCTCLVLAVAISAVQGRRLQGDEGDLPHLPQALYLGDVRLLAQLSKQACRSTDCTDKQLVCSPLLCYPYGYGFAGAFDDAVLMICTDHAHR